jgi:hypothetical protein
MKKFIVRTLVVLMLCAAIPANSVALSGGSSWVQVSNDLLSWDVLPEGESACSWKYYRLIRTSGNIITYSGARSCYKRGM